MFNQNLPAGLPAQSGEGRVKKLMLFSVILAIVGVFCLAFITNQALAASGQNQKIRQVKTAASPTVYYLDYKRGLKKSYLSEAAFLSYGNKWSDIKIISQAQLDKWPELKLIKSAGEKNIYYLKGNKKALIKGPSDFSSFGLNYGQVAQIGQADFLSYQVVDYTGVGLVADTGGAGVKSGGGNPSLLTVTVDPGNQPSGFLPMNSRRNLAAIFNFRAGGSPVEVKMITLTIRGVYQPEVIERIYLVNQAEYMLGEPTGLSGRQAIFNFANDSFIIPAGETKKIRVYLDLKSYSNFINHGLQIALNSPEAIRANAEISGNFPLSAGEYKFAVGSLLGQARIEESAVNSGNKLIIGNNERIIGKFKISETSNRENLIMKKIILVNAAAAHLTNLANFKLKDSNNYLIAQSIGSLDNEVVFNLNNYPLSQGQFKTFLLLADIVNGENETVNFNLRDFFATGETYGYGLVFSQLDNNEVFSIIRQPLNILSRELSPSALVFSRQSGAIIGNFQIRNNNLKIYLNNLTVSLEKNSTAPNFSETVYLVNYNSGEVYAAVDGSRLLNGTSLGFNGLALAPGQEINFSLITNLPALARNGDKYRIMVNKISYQYDQSQIFEDAPALYGNYLTVTKSSLYLYPNHESWDRNYIKGQPDLKIASFIMEAAAGDDIIINQITLSKSGDTSGSVLYANGFSNLRLYLGNNRVGNAIDRPLAANYVFDNFNYGFRAGDRLELRLYADTARDLRASEAQLMVASLAAKSRNSQVASAVFGLPVASQKTYFGETKAEIKALNGGSFIPGIRDNNVGRFSIANHGAEDIRLENINLVTTSDGFSYSLGFSDLTIIEASQLGVISRISRPVAGANRIGLNGHTVKSGQTVEFIIRVSVSETAPASGFEIYLSELEVFGKKSGLRVEPQGDPTDKIAVNGTSPRNNNDNEAGAVAALAWPVASRRINYAFHDLSYPFRSTAEHNGIDIEVDQGTSVRAAASGLAVEVVNNQTAQYNYVIIEHGNGLKTTYGHLSEINLNLGDLAARGQIIGLSGGQSGSIGSGQNTNGPHLHFGVNQNGHEVDPMGFLN